MAVASVSAKEKSSSTVRIVALLAGEPVGEWGFEKDVVTVGRSMTADVCLKDNKKVSRVHCTVEVRPDGLFVKDANSANGTWLNGRRVFEAKVMPDDLIVVAGLRLRASVELPVPEPALDDVLDDVTPPEPSSIPMLSVVPAAPVDTDKTLPEIHVPKTEPAAPPAPAPVAAVPQEPVLVQERPAVDPMDRGPETEKEIIAPRGPALTVGGKRREKSGPRPVAPAAMAPVVRSNENQGISPKKDNSKLLLWLALGAVAMFLFFGMIVVVGIAAWFMLS